MGRQGQGLEGGSHVHRGATRSPKTQGMDLPGSLQKEHSAARCQNCARINVCCFKPPSLWSLVQHLRKLTRCPSFSPPWSSPSFPDSVADTTTQCQARPRGRVGLASQHPILIHPALCILLTQFQSLRSPLYMRDCRGDTSPVTEEASGEVK